MQHFFCMFCHALYQSFDVYLTAHTEERLEANWSLDSTDSSTGNTGYGHGMLLGTESS